MRRLIRMGLAAVICCLGITVSANTAWGYTEAQKRQAKAWLSAHGYPPTWDGAYQAYDDWLEGKWWDEFGSPEEYYSSDEEERPTAATQRSYEGEKQRGSSSQKSNSEPADEKAGVRNAGGEDAILYFLSNVLEESEDSPERLGDMESLLADLSRERGSEEAAVEGSEAETAEEEPTVSPETESRHLTVTQAAETPAAAPESESPTQSRIPWILCIIGVLVVLLLAAVRSERRKKR